MSVISGTIGSLHVEGSTASSTKDRKIEELTLAVQLLEGAVKAHQDQAKDAEIRRLSKRLRELGEAP